MNKVPRILGSAALATGLIFGGSTGVAFAGDDKKDDRRSSHYDRHDDKRDNNRDHRDDRKGNNHRGHEDRNGHGRFVFDHKHHDDDCKGKYHRAWYKDGHGRWQFIIVILY